MSRSRPADISRFFVVGINYKKTNDLVSGSFAINRDQYEQILNFSGSKNLPELFVLSTCNRTEIYGFADEADQLIDLICTQTTGSRELFAELAYIKNGPEAIAHIFSVSAGMDSQILGDYEIVGQIKQAIRIAKEKDCVHSFLDRLINFVLQSSKLVKNQTCLSDGTVSVSFAAVQWIKENLEQVTDKKILLVGVRKMGRNTCKNLKDYLRTNQITLINRSEEKASELAQSLGLTHAPISKLEEKIHESDIILVATNAEEPLLLKRHFPPDSNKLVIDLSIPLNVEKSVAELPHVKLVSIDELSKMKDETLQKREAEIPKARAIIADQIREFMSWHDMRKQAGVLKAIKTKLKEIHTSPLFDQLPTQHQIPAIDENIQRIINGTASKMRSKNQDGCHYIEAIHEFIATGTN
jgi:glutamyl-tRNA reductase